MGAEKMKEKGMDDMDAEKMTEQLEKFKNMSADSLKMMMNKGMEALDSMKEVMKQK
jgi:hypothetical protein